ncbi:MAG: beta strand repeat-containing protein [Methyloligellaceae bacterium]
MATINGTLGDDVLIGSLINDDIYGLDGDDLLLGRSGDDFIETDDSVSGNSGDDFAFGGDGDDLIISLAGDNILFGGEGDDIISAYNSTASGSLNLLFGGSGGDIIYDSLVDDIVFTGTGPDIVYLTAGNDFVIGKDNVTSPSDLDSVSYLFALDGVTGTLSGGLNTIESNVVSTNPGDTAQVGLDYLVNVDRIAGSEFDDTFLITNTFRGMYDGYDGTVSGPVNMFNAIEGGDGNDSITGNGYTRLDFITADGGVTVDLASGSSFGSVGGATNVGTDSFTGVNYIKASAYDDILLGSNQAFGENFRGLQGDDYIDGAGGGADRADYRNSPNGIIADLSVGPIGSGTVHDGFGTIDTLVNIENLRGSGNSDMITMDDGDNWVVARGGNDTVYGLGGDDILESNSGDDFLDGGDGNDILDASGNGFDRLVGGAGNDIIIGGGNGNSSGGNRAEYTSATGAITVNLAGGIGSFGSSVVGDASVGTDTLDSVERVRGSNFDDIFIADITFEGEFGSFNEFEGRNGNDTFTGNGHTRIRYTNANGAMTIDLLAGTAMGSAVGGATNQGIDTIISGVNQVRGGDFDDTLLGSNGVDFESFRGQAGNDTIDGRGGLQDQADYRNSSNGIIADLSAGAIGSGTVQDGFGTVDTLSNIEQIRGSDNSDTITMDDGDNVVEGKRGNDFIEGLGGADILFGGKGNDTIYGGTGNDIIEGGEGNDLLIGQAGSDTLIGGDGFDRYIGGGGDDVFIGGNSGNQNGGDRAEYTNATGAIVVNLTGAIGSFASTVTGDASVGTDTLENIEMVRGTAFNDIFVADASFESEYPVSPQFNEFEGLDGDDSITGNGSTRVSYVSANGNVTVDLLAGTAFGSAVGGASNIGTDTLLGGISTIRGSTFDDTLFGSNSSNFEMFEGREGNDFIDGQGGDNDWADYKNSANGIIANLASGIVQDGFGSTDTLLNIEAIRGSGFNDIIFLDNGNNRASGRGGDDVIAGQFGDDIIDGGSGDDIISGDEGNDDLTGGAGDDAISGGDGDDFFISGFDFIHSPDDTNDGDDAYDGGAGVDFVNYSSAVQNINVNLSNPALGIAFGDDIGTDVLLNIEGVITGLGDDTIRGSSFDDILIAQGGVDFVFGGFGNDIIDGGDGTDSLFGEEGNDHIIGGLGDDGLDGGDGNDTLEGGAGVDWIYGRLGDDIIQGGDGIDALFGGDGDDNIEGGADGDSLDGGLGNDILSGDDGVDWLFGGDGVDTLYGGADTDALFGGAGNDNMSGGAGGDNLDGGFGDDTMSGDDGNDWLFGSFGDDTINGGADTDALFGQEGNDILIGGDGGDSLDGGVDNDQIYGGTGVDWLFGQAGNDLLDGGADNDVLFAGDGSDSLYGGAGGDTLDGGAGNDLLDGGDGIDVLYGDAGADTFYFTDPSEGGDVVRDFVSGVDTVGIDQAGFGLAVSGPLPASMFETGAGLPANFSAAGPVFYLDTVGQGLWFDPTGGSSADVMIVAGFETGVPALTDIEIL